MIRERADMCLGDSDGARGRLTGKEEALELFRKHC